VRARPRWVPHLVEWLKESIVDIPKHTNGKLETIRVHALPMGHHLYADVRAYLRDHPLGPDPGPRPRSSRLAERRRPAPADPDRPPPAQLFLDSPEFQARQTTNTEFVTLLYRVFLNRAPDAVGLAGWLALLDQGMARGTISCSSSPPRPSSGRSSNGCSHRTAKDRNGLCPVMRRPVVLSPAFYGRLLSWGSARCLCICPSLRSEEAAPMCRLHPRNVDSPRWQSGGCNLHSSEEENVR